MVVGIAMVRDEADIVARTVGHMAGQVDRVLVADNGSTDGTREILDRLPGVTVIDDPVVGYFQSEKMTALAEQARVELGATWVVPFDADELWLTRTSMPFRCALATLPGHVLVCQADLYDHVATAEDPDDPDPVTRLGWRRSYAAALPKVACRALEGLVIHQGNHSAAYEHTDLPATVANVLTIRHYPYRSAEQVIRKVRNGAAAYAAATGLPAEFGAHWRQWGQMLEEHGEDAIRELFHQWHYRQHPGEPLRIEGERQPALVFDPAPVPCPA